MAKKAAVETATPVKRKRRRRNKSAAIRAYVQAHPTASTAEIVAGLREQRIKVSAAFVSTIKSKANGAAKKASATAEAPQTPYGQFRKAGELFSEALELVMKAGAKEAEDLVHMASKLVARIRERGS